MKSILARIFPGMYPKPPVLVEVPDPVAPSTWADPRVQVIYQILSDTDMVVPEDQHWEGYVARLCADALVARGLTGTYVVPNYQARVHDWLNEIFEQEHILDVQERARRLIEEATELVQSVGMSKEEVLFEVNNVYEKPPGQVHQEIGGTLTTLTAFAIALKLDVNECGEEELARVWTNIAKIRAKNAAKKRYQKED